jgi:2-keto-3-deoxy-L-rhamnonate aldolase RhmA
VIGINVPLRDTTTKEMIEGAVAAHDVPVDFIFLDGQHSPLNEDTVARLCGYAHELGLPMHFRIKHTQNTHLIGAMLDLGPALIEVPQVETVETAQDAVENFYFRNWKGGRGRRSWGGNQLAFNPEDIGSRTEYTEWWNHHGILAMQLESINAYSNADKLALAGVDLLTWGPADTVGGSHSLLPLPFPARCTLYMYGVSNGEGRACITLDTSVAAV